MIESFKVKADNLTNRLVIQLRGFFMKSEVELAFYLARKEVKKLTNGYEVILDLDGMHTEKTIEKNLYTKAKRVFSELGASSVKSIGVVSKMSLHQVNDLEYFAFDSVGFYPN